MCFLTFLKKPSIFLYPVNNFKIILRKYSRDRKYVTFDLNANIPLFNKNVIQERSMYFRILCPRGVLHSSAVTSLA